MHVQFLIYVVLLLLDDPEPQPAKCLSEIPGWGEPWVARCFLEVINVLYTIIVLACSQVMVSIASSIVADSSYPALNRWSNGASEYSFRHSVSSSFHCSISVCFVLTPEPILIAISNRRSRMRGSNSCAWTSIVNKFYKFHENESSPNRQFTPFTQTHKHSRSMGRTARIARIVASVQCDLL